jgi:hypothetical protein
MKTARLQGRRNRPHFRVVALMAVMALVIAACGNGDDAPVDTADDAPADTADDVEEVEEEAAPFYAENDLELYVATGPGGGAGAIGEFMAPWMSRCIEGNPTVTVTYASSGGGGIAGANAFAASRNRGDGTRIMQTTLSSVTNAIFGGDEIQYDFADFVAVAAYPVSGVIYASPDTGVETIEDVPNATEQLIKGGNSPPASDIQYILALEALDLRQYVDEVWGYPGTGDHQLAFTQGETNIDGTTTTLWNNSPFLVDEGLANLILALGFPGEGTGGYDRDPANPDAPTVPEAYEMLYGEEISGEAWEAFRTVHGQIAVATSHVFHKDAPQAAIDAVRDGIEACTQLPEFQEAAEEVLGGYETYAGDRVEIVNEIRRSADPEVIAWTRNFLSQAYPDEYSG